MQHKTNSRSSTSLFDTLESRILLSGDDHPDWSEFPSATPLSLAPVLADPPWQWMEASGTLDSIEDTDVFSFTPPENAWYGFVILLSGTPDPPWVAVAGQVRDAAGNPLMSLIDAQRGGIAATTWGPGSYQYPSTFLNKGETYYLGVSSGQLDLPLESLPIGPYRMIGALWCPPGRDGNDGGDGPGDDGNNDGNQGGNEGGEGDWGGDDWRNWGDGNGGNDDGPDVPPLLVNDDFVGGIGYGLAAPVVLTGAGGSGARGGSIEQAGDTDLFRFSVEQSGPVHLRLGSANGGLHAGLRIYDDRLNEVAFDSTGAPGAIADLTFTARPGTYYARVEPEGASTGAYALQVHATASEFVLYYPEGFRAVTIDERVHITNPGDAPAHYSLTARYEVGQRDQVIAQGTLLPGAGALIRLSNPADPDAPGVRPNTPYALELRSDALLAATLRHDDFGATTGSPFTGDLSTHWTFPEARNLPGQANDFLVYYNPSEQATTVTITLYYEDGDTATFSRRLDAHRRGGVNLATDPGVPATGRFGVRIDSATPIVAAISSYSAGDAGGFGMLGAPSGLTRGVIPSIVVADSAADSRITFLNFGATIATVRLSVAAVNAGKPQQVRIISVPAQGTATLATRDFGFQPGQAIGVAWSTVLPVTAVGYQSGGFGAASSSGLAWSSAAISGGRWAPDSTSAGTMSLYNPADQASTVTLTFRFTDGTRITRQVGVGAGSFRRIDFGADLDLPESMRGRGFTIRLDGSVPVVGLFAIPNGEHAGQWSALVEPIGLETPIERF